MKKNISAIKKNIILNIRNLLLASRLRFVKNFPMLYAPLPDKASPYGVIVQGAVDFGNITPYTNLPTTGVTVIHLCNVYGFDGIIQLCGKGLSPTFGAGLSGWSLCGINDQGQEHLGMRVVGPSGSVTWETANGSYPGHAGSMDSSIWRWYAATVSVPTTLASGSVALYTMNFGLNQLTTEPLSAPIISGSVNTSYGDDSAQPLRVGQDVFGNGFNLTTHAITLVFNRVLSPTEILSVMQSPASNVNTSVLASWLGIHPGLRASIDFSPNASLGVWTKDNSRNHPIGAQEFSPQSFSTIPAIPGVTPLGPRASATFPVRGGIYRTDNVTTARLVSCGLKLPDLGSSFDHTRLRFTDSNGIDRPLGTEVQFGRNYASGCPKAINVWVQLNAGESTVAGTWSYVASSRGANFTPKPVPSINFVYPDAAILVDEPGFNMSAWQDVFSTLSEPGRFPVSECIRYQEDACIGVVRQPNVLVAQGSSEGTVYDLFTTGPNTGTNADGIAMYERGQNFIAQWCRTGDPQWWFSATRKIGNFIQWFANNKYGVQSWFRESMDIAGYYFLSGDTRAHIAIRAFCLLASRALNTTRYQGVPYILNDWLDDRDYSRMVQSMRAAWLLNVLDQDPPNFPAKFNGADDNSTFEPYASTSNYLAIINETVNRISSSTDGAMRSSQYPANQGDLTGTQNPSDGYLPCGQKCYMSYMTLCELTGYYDQVDSTRNDIVTQVKRAHDYMLTQAWIPFDPNGSMPPANGGLMYATVNFSGANGSSAGRNLSSGYTALNTFPMFISAWLGYRLQDPGYGAWYDAFEPGLRNLPTRGSQQTDEAFWKYWHAVALRGLTPSSGASTAPTLRATV